MSADPKRWSATHRQGRGVEFAVRCARPRIPVCVAGETSLGLGRWWLGGWPAWVGAAMLVIGWP